MVIRVDGEPVRCRRPVEQTIDDWAAFDPDAMPVDAVGHYLDRGALRTVTTARRRPDRPGTAATAYRRRGLGRPPHR